MWNRIGWAVVLICVLPFAMLTTVFCELALAYRNLHVINRMRDCWRRIVGMWVQEVSRK
jgi:hypothetical protein